MISCRLEKDANTVGLWHLNEGSGTTAKDSSGNGNNGTITAAAYVDTILGKGLSLDGSSKYITVPNSAPLNPASAITLEIILKSKAVQTGIAIAKGSEVQYRLYKADITDKLAFNLTTSVNAYGLIGNTALGVGRWRYVAATYDGANMRLFLDGVSDGSASASGTIVTTTNGLCFGVQPFPSNAYYANMDIACVRVSNIARSAAEIKQNWLRMPQILTA